MGGGQWDSIPREVKFSMSQKGTRYSYQWPSLHLLLNTLSDMVWDGGMVSPTSQKCVTHHHNRESRPLTGNSTS